MRVIVRIRTQQSFEGVVYPSIESSGVNTLINPKQKLEELVRLELCTYGVQLVEAQSCIITIRPIEPLNIPLRSNLKPFRPSLHILTFQMRTKLLVLTTLAGSGVS